MNGPPMNHTTTCVICGGTATEAKGHRTPLCFECLKAWLESPEAGEFASARDRFIERRRKEIGAA